MTGKCGEKNKGKQESSKGDYYYKVRKIWLEKYWFKDRRINIDRQEGWLNRKQEHRSIEGY